MRITLSQLSTKDLATLLERVITLSKQTQFNSILNNHPLLEALNTAAEEYRQSYSKSTYSGKGNQVAEADKKRDDLFNGIKHYLNGYTKLTELPHHKSAVELYEILKRYGLKLDTLSYSSESAQLNNLISELSQEANQSKLQAVQLADSFKKLKQAQQQFEQLITAQATANAKLREIKTATELRKNVEEKLKNYLNLVTSMREVNKWQQLYLDLNEVVKAAKGS